MSTIFKRHCPIKGCTNSRRQSDVMCSHHWHMVSPHLQKRVWDTYKSGFSKEWMSATLAAINEVNQALGYPSLTPNRNDTEETK